MSENNPKPTTIKTQGSSSNPVKSTNQVRPRPSSASVGAGANSSFRKPGERGSSAVRSRGNGGDSKTRDPKKKSGPGSPGRNNRRGGGRNSERKEYEEAILQVNRVTRVTKGGRQMRFRVSVVIGNQKGKVGFGIGKATEVVLAVQKAIAKAKKDLFEVPIFEDSIPHAVTSSFKATKVIILPAKEGKGVIAGSATRKILELAGIKNVLSKIHGSRNRINVARATLIGLSQLRKSVPLVGPKKKISTEEVVSTTDIVSTEETVTTETSK